MLRVFVWVMLAALGTPVWATTLQQLSLDTIIQKSTAIVRGRAQPATTVVRGSIIYSHFKIQVSEVWKGSLSTQIDAAVPGGVLDGKQQTYAGSPIFADGQEYVFFLWTSRPGLTQIIGLSQGLFTLTPASNGTLTVTRNASPVRMLDAAGNQVTDTSFTMLLTDFKQKVTNTLSERAAK